MEAPMRFVSGLLPLLRRNRAKAIALSGLSVAAVGISVWLVAKLRHRNAQLLHLKLQGKPREPRESASHRQATPDRTQSKEQLAVDPWANNQRQADYDDRSSASSRSDEEGNAEIPEIASRTPFARLRITVVEAAGLIARDLSFLSGKPTTSDPYCVLKLLNWPERPEAGITEHKTSTVYETLSPKWNENFAFSIVTPYPQLHIEIYDEDLLTTDDSLGTVKIDIMALFPPAAGSTLSGWFDVVEPQGVPEGARPREHCGRLCLELEWERYGWYEHFQILAYPPPLPPPVFDADKVYAPLTKLGAAVETLSYELRRSEVKYLCEVLVWSRPFESACLLACWLYFAAHYLDCILALPVAALACFILLCRAYPSPDNAPATQEEPTYDRRRERHLSRTAHYLSRLLPFKVRKVCRSLQEPLAAGAGSAQEVANLLTGRHTWSLLFAVVLLFIAALLVMLPPVQVTPAGHVTFATVGTLALLLPSGALQMASGSVKYLAFLRHRSQVHRIA